MKVLHIITGLNNGGAEAVLYRLAAADHEAGNAQVVVSLMDRGVYADRLEAAGSTVECLNMPRGRVTLRGLAKLYRCIRAVRPDVIQTWMYHADLVGGIVARMAGVRAVVWGIRHASFDLGVGNKRPSLVIRLCAMLSSSVPARIACCSRNAVRLHEGIGYRVDKIIVIPNGYAVDRIKPCVESGIKIRRQLGIDDEKPVLGMVARFDPHKDHANLLLALAALSRQGLDYNCLLVGDHMTPDNEALMTMIRQAGVEKNVLLLGPRRDIPAIMNALDVHVLSSLGEAFPNVLAEAMACGTPCITTDVGDAALIVGNTGWVIPARDPVALTLAIDHALGERRDLPMAWQSRRAESRKRILENFSLEKMVSAYRALWVETQETFY